MSAPGRGLGAPSSGIGDAREAGLANLQQRLETAGAKGAALTRADNPTATAGGRQFGIKGSPEQLLMGAVLTKSAGTPEQARAAIRARQADLAASHPDGKLTAQEAQSIRVELLHTYGLVRPDGQLDHDRFYRGVVLGASNTTKEAWLKDYEAVRTFVDELQARITPAEVAAFAPSIHDNGYWKDRAKEIATTKVTSGEHLLLGLPPSFPAPPGGPAGAVGAEEKRFLSFLTPAGQAAYAARFDQPGGAKLLLSHVQPEKWLAFFAAFGPQKSQESLAAFLLPNGQPNPQLSPAKLQIFNSNAGSWCALEAQAQQFRDPAARLGVMRDNQTAAMASTFALTKSSEPLSFSQMDYATAVIWRYTGHWSGKNGFDEVYQVKTDYFSADFDADRLKDGPVWRAVLDRQLELAGVTNPDERFLRNVIARSTNESKQAFVSSVDAISDRVSQVRAELAEEIKANPQQVAKLALVSHDLGYWPGVKAQIADPASAAFGRAPELKGKAKEKFLSLLTEDGKKLYESRFDSAGGYKILGKHIADKPAFVAFMNAELGFSKTCAIKDKEQVFNANYGSWADLETDLPKFDAKAGEGARLGTMMKNQESNIIMTRMLSSTDSFLSGMQMSHGMAVLWRYVVGDYQGEYAFDGKDRYGRPDPEGWRNGSPQVRINYYDPEFKSERKKDYEMWSSLLLAMASADGKHPAQGFKEQILLRSANETKLAWHSTLDPIVRQHQALSGQISEADLDKFAPLVHDRGYWASERQKIDDPSNPLLGSHLDVEGKIEPHLSPAAREAWKNRYDPGWVSKSELPPGTARLGAKGYQFTSEMFAGPAALTTFYKSVGKNEAAIAAARASPTVVLNENAMSYADAQAEAQRHADPAARESKVKNNQKAAIASGLMLADLELTVEEVAYLTAVLWRATGHYEGEDAHGNPRSWQVSADYLMGLDRGERTKDLAVQLAVYEVLGKSPKLSGVFEVDTAVPPEALGRNGVPREVTRDLDLQIGDALFLRIDGKWYPAKVENYRGDGLIDGTLDADMSRGTAYWQADGFMVRTDQPVPGVFMPPHGLFLTGEQLAAEVAKKDLGERMVLKAK